MARPAKNTVDYFTHECIRDKERSIIENEFGHEGYVFYFKLQELLGRSQGHHIKCSTPADWKYFCYEVSIDKDKAIKIINLMLDLELLDRFFWEEHQIIWWPRFLALLAPVYKKRQRALPGPKVSIEKIENDLGEEVETWN